MEPPVSSSRGPMGSLLWKLDWLESQHLLRKPVRESFDLLKEDLEGIDTFLLELSDEDDPNLMKQYWMKEVREICYDTEDYIDWLFHSQLKIGSVGVAPRLKISRLPRTLNPRPNIVSQIKELRSRLQDASERHKRYLIVIDDLWDTAVWDFLLRAFPDGTQSSRIITTTRSENVDMTCCGNRSDYILKMEPLNDDDSRKIFFARVFGSENKCPQQFKDASYEIVRKCGGVPLAVIHIAGLLTRQQEKSEEWDYVERSLGSNLSITTTYKGMRKVINLSYNGLPQCLKT
ncbi:disease resistance protein RGA5-like isoform X4 [Miscanthus floridulus]|uniref:disease resistance protein RGA5-like isoform X4 n=1 Tax=Miscanthus floridulus TaxID=154761 RepID=UPI00345849E3